MDSSKEIENIDMGLYYDHKRKCYFRGYDKDKTTPLNKDGVYVMIDNISLQDSIKTRKEN